MPSGRPARLRARAVPLLVALIVAGTYAFSLQRDVGFWDTGELQTVPYILGLMHPTGFPAEILLGWCFTHAFAFGAPALRMNALCMLCVVAAAASVCALAQLLGARAAVAAGAALSFAVTPAVWAHATHADVTDPALALCALTLLAALAAIVRDEPRALLLAAVTAGTALGTHGMVVWFLPLPLVMVMLSRKPGLLRVLPACVLASIVLAAALYAYLPLRSIQVTSARLDPTLALGIPAGAPFWDLGDPSTPRGFLNIVTGRTVGAPTSLAAPFEPSGYARDAAFLFDQLLGNYAWPALALLLVFALAGAWGSWQRAALFLPLLLVTPFAASFVNESDVTRYYTFPLLCVWVLAAVGLSRLAALARGSSAGAALLAAALPIGFAAFEAYQGRGTFEERNDLRGRTYVAGVLASTGPRAILIAEWVYATPLAYAAYVEGSMQQRILVAGSADELAPQLAGWTAQRPVYAIAERAPNVPGLVVLVRALGVNPLAAHDPKLYRIGPARP